MAAGTWRTFESSTRAQDVEESLSTGPSANFDFRFERMHTCFHLGRAAFQLYTHTLAKIPSASVLIFLSFLIFLPSLSLHHCVIWRCVVSLLIIICLRVTAQEDRTWHGRSTWIRAGTHSAIPHRAKDLSSPLGVVCLCLDVTRA